MVMDAEFNGVWVDEADLEAYLDPNATRPGPCTCHDLPRPTPTTRTLRLLPSITHCCPTWSGAIWASIRKSPMLSLNAVHPAQTWPRTLHLPPARSSPVSSGGTAADLKMLSSKLEGSSIIVPRPLALAIPRYKVWTIVGAMQDVELHKLHGVFHAGRTPAPSLGTRSGPSSAPCRTSSCTSCTGCSTQGAHRRARAWMGDPYGWHGGHMVQLFANGTHEVVFDDGDRSSAVRHVRTIIPCAMPAVRCAAAPRRGGQIQWRDVCSRGGDEEEVDRRSMALWIV